MNEKNLRCIITHLLVNLCEISLIGGETNATDANGQEMSNHDIALANISRDYGKLFIRMKFILVIWPDFYKFISKRLLYNFSNRNISPQCYNFKINTTTSNHRD